MYFCDLITHYIKNKECCIVIVRFAYRELLCVLLLWSGTFTFGVERSKYVKIISAVRCSDKENKYFRKILCVSISSLHRISANNTNVSSIYLKLYNLDLCIDLMNTLYKGKGLCEYRHMQ